jgi:hypothetical protein
MKDEQKLKLGNAPAIPRNIQEVQALKLGDAQGILSFITRHQVIVRYTIFLLLHMRCVVLGASYFLFLVKFSFVFFE